MAAGLEACENELAELLRKIEKTRESVADALEALKRAKEAVNDLPDKCLSDNLKQLLSSVTQEIGLTQASTSPPIEKLPNDEKCHQNVVGITNAGSADSVMTSQKDNEIGKKKEIIQSTAQDLKSTDETKVEDLTSWAEVKEMDVIATSSLLADGSFWCKPVDSAIQRNYLKEISDQLRKHTLHNRDLWNCDTKNLEQLVCVLSKTHNLWLRAMIEKECSEHELILRYVDIGKTEKMQRSRINCVPDEMKSIKTLALKCCFQEENIKVSYEMKWRFSDLTKKRLSLNVKNEIKGTFMSKYVVSLFVPEDPVIDIGDIICGQSKADSTVDTCLPSKDVRFYNATNGRNGKISMIRDTHNNDHKDDDVKTSNEDIKEKKEPVMETEDSPKDTEDIDFGISEDDEKLDWADVCQTPDVTDDKEITFPPEAGSQDVSNQKSEVGENSAQADFIEGKSDVSESNDDQKAEIGKENKDEATVEVKEDDKKEEDREVPNDPKEHATVEEHASEQEHNAEKNHEIMEECETEGVHHGEQDFASNDQGAVEEDVAEKETCDLEKLEAAKEHSTEDKVDVAAENMGLKNLEGVYDAVEENDTEFENVAVNEHSDVKDHDIVKECDEPGESAALEQNDAQNECDSVKEHDSVKEQDAVKEHDSVKEQETEKEHGSMKEKDDDVRKNNENFNENCDDDYGGNGSSHSDYIEEFQEVTENVNSNIKTKSEMVLQKRLNILTSEKQQKYELKKDRSNKESLEREVDTTSSSNQWNESSNRNTFIQSEEAWDEETDDHYKFPENTADSHRNSQKKFPDQNERDNWLSKQLNGLSHKSLIDPEAKYFVLLKSYKAMCRGFLSGKFTVSKPLEDHLKNHKKYPIIVLFYATKMYDNVIQDNVRLCGVGIARSDAYNSSFVTLKGEHKQITVFDVELVCRAKTRRLFQDNLNSGDELSRSEAHRRLTVLDGLIRKGLVDELYDLSAKSSAVPQQPQQQAPWLKHQPPKSNFRQQNNENDAYSRDNGSENKRMSSSDRKHDTFTYHEPEELWSPVETTPRYPIQFDNVDNEQSHASELSPKHAEKSEKNTDAKADTEAPISDTQNQTKQRFDVANMQSDVKQPAITQSQQQQQQSDTRPSQQQQLDMRQLQQQQHQLDVRQSQQHQLDMRQSQEEQLEMRQSHQEQLELRQSQQQQHQLDMRQSQQELLNMRQSLQQQNQLDMRQSQQQQQPSANPLQNLTQEQMQQLLYQYQMQMMQQMQQTMMQQQQPLSPNKSQEQPHNQAQLQFQNQYLQQQQQLQLQQQMMSSQFQQQPQTQQHSQSQQQPQFQQQPQYQQPPQSQQQVQFQQHQQPHYQQQSQSQFLVQQQYTGAPYQLSSYQMFPSISQQHYSNTTHGSPRRLGSSKIGMKSSSSDDFGSDDEAERDMRKEYDIYNLNENDL